MNKMILALSLAALGVAVYATVQSELQSDAKDERIEQLARNVGDLQREMEDLGVRFDGMLAGDQRPAPLTSAPSTEAGGTSVGLATRKPASPLARLAELEKTVKRQNDLLAKMDSTHDKADDAASMMRRFMPKNVYFNPKMAAKALDLDEGQASEMQDILERGKGELKDLYEIENDDGETWNEVRKPKMADIGGSSGFHIAMPDFAKIQKFKKRRIPGSSETFGEAEKRIKKNTFENVRRTLPPDKAKTWDGAHKDGLLRDGGMGGISVSSVVIETPDDK